MITTSLVNMSFHIAILITLHFCPPPSTFTVLISYFYRWFYYFYLSTFLLILYIVDLLLLLYFCLYQWDFSFCNFHVSNCGLFFSILTSSFSIYCTACLVVLNSFSFCLCVKLWSLYQTWLKTLLGRIFLVVGFSLSLI